MEFRFIHFYPDLMSLYGSYANAAALRRYLERLGHTVSVEAVRPGETSRLSGADFLFMGAGTERAARAAMEDFARFGSGLKAAAQDGATMLFAGTAMELLGKTVTEADGSRCIVTMTQQICVTVPVRYGVTMTAGEPTIACADSCTGCGCC